jgi:hypothetical protein
MKGLVPKLALAAALALVGVPAAGASPPSLLGQYATLQFSGSTSVSWTVPLITRQGGCLTIRIHGAGIARTTYNSIGRHALMSMVDSGGAGGSIAFQPQAFDLATPDHKAPDFGSAHYFAKGSVMKEYTGDGSPGCDVPADESADESGCGGDSINWMAKPLELNGKLLPEVYGFVPNRIAGHCPIYGEGAAGAMPQETATAVPAAELRSVLGRPNGKLIIRGSQRWKTEYPYDAGKVLATTTVTWEAILIHAHPCTPPGEKEPPGAPRLPVCK